MPRPLILISPHTEIEGTELPDAAVSLSRRYSEAVIAAGGLPWILPPTADAALVAEAVARADAVLLSGGEDVAPHLYAPDLPEAVRATVIPATGDRDLFEFVLINEVFRQAKPLLAICRGQQILNVALGGTLHADITLQVPGAERHARDSERLQPVHEIEIEPDSLLHRLVGAPRLGVNSTHHQSVARVAPPLRVTGRAPDGVIEALEFTPDQREALPFFLSVQFHPERLYDRHPAHARLFTAFVDAARPSGVHRDRTPSLC